MTHFPDDLYLGPAPTGIVGRDNSPGGVGIGPAGRVIALSFVPAQFNTMAVAPLQALAAAGNLTLASGAGTTLGSAPDGSAAIVLDVPRTPLLGASGADLTAVTFTIFGFDQYGSPMTVARLGPSDGNSVAVSKAFKYVTRVALSAGTGAAQASVGIGDNFGLPVRVSDAGLILSVKWAGALAQDAGTVTLADATSPATSATTDVRGMYMPSSSSNGSRRLVMAIALTEDMVGPRATRLAALGVIQA